MASPLASNGGKNLSPIWKDWQNPSVLCQECWYSPTTLCDESPHLCASQNVSKVKQTGKKFSVLSVPLQIWLDVGSDPSLSLLYVAFKSTRPDLWIKRLGTSTSQTLLWVCMSNQYLLQAMSMKMRQPLLPWVSLCCSALGAYLLSTLDAWGQWNRCSSSSSSSGSSSRRSGSSGRSSMQVPKGAMEEAWAPL